MSKNERRFSIIMTVYDQAGELEENLPAFLQQEYEPGFEVIVVDESSTDRLLTKADKVLFPGQGHAREAMEYLRARRLDEVIRSLKQPVFGICVGQQLLCKHSEEGDVDCIGIFDAEVKRFQPERHEDKVPCMGWNRIEVRSEECGVSPLMEGLGENPYVYFVHSYHETSSLSEM